MIGLCLFSVASSPSWCVSLCESQSSSSSLAVTHHCSVMNACTLLFSYRRQKKFKQDHIEVFKILNRFENIDRNICFSLKKDSRTRGHNEMLVKDQCRLGIRKYSFSQRTINKWNKLMTD